MAKLLLLYSHCFRIWVQCACLLSIAICAQSCGETKPAETLEQKLARAEHMTPSDPVLAEKYARTCRGCHINPDSTAPLAGDKDEWNKRFRAGNRQVIGNLQNGIRLMPPRGQCLDCSDDELWQMTLFMSDRTGSK